MIKKNKIDNFKKRFNNIPENMQIIEKEINEVVQWIKKQDWIITKIKK